MLFKNSVFVAAMLLSPFTVVGRTLKANKGDKGDKGANKREKRFEETIDALNIRIDTLTTLVEEIATLVGNNDKDNSAIGEVCGQAIAGKSACESDALKKKNLFVQTGMNCKLTLIGDGTAKLVTDDISNTFQFAEIPSRDEEELSTSEFILDFPRFFPEGSPNAAITFVSSDDEDMALATPLVAIFSNPMMAGGGISYDIEQSPNQNDVLTIESLFADGPVVNFVTCSIFIDNAGDIVAQAACEAACVTVSSACEVACLATAFFPPALFICEASCGTAEVVCTTACSLA